jgi:superoxide dismutase
MNKFKFLKLIIIGLLVSNGVLLFMLFKEHVRKGGPKAIIIEKLHFDKEQIKNYETYIQQHRKAIDNNEAILNKLRSSLFEQLKYKQDTTKIDSLISKIAMQQNLAEKINYNHFLEIKRLCKPSQQKYFNELTTEIANLFSSKERK